VLSCRYPRRHSAALRAGNPVGPLRLIGELDEYAVEQALQTAENADDA
jgi:hypothetical protein